MQAYLRCCCRCASEWSEHLSIAVLSNKKLSWCWETRATRWRPHSNMSNFRHIFPLL